MNNNLVQVSNDEQPSAQAAVQICTTPVVQEETPTSDAEVKIELTKTNFRTAMRVPGPHAARMINAAPRILGLVGSLVGPVVLLKSSVDVVMPWWGLWGLVVVIALLPLVHVVVGNRHDRSSS
ncbi:hypothetical protein [Streptomyces sp. IBSBF 2806]|uniref:hypothetical protein n=1 Tax=Streptomyces sp. IBSBF 2806 TaxID=2903529 RepID=UPI002FDBEF4E